MSTRARRRADKQGPFPGGSRDLSQQSRDLAMISRSRHDLAAALLLISTNPTLAQLSFASGLEATLIHTRVAKSYDHRLDIVCEKGTVQVTNPLPGDEPLSFSSRFHDSYIAQMDTFVNKICTGDVSPNISLERTQFLESLSEVSCPTHTHSVSPVFAAPTLILERPSHLSLLSASFPTPVPTQAPTSAAIPSRMRDGLQRSLSPSIGVRGFSEGGWCGSQA